MKKIITGIAIAIVLFSMVVPDAWVWCKKVLLNEPTTHTIQKGEYLSKLSLKYYGSAKYWQELALVNRAPNSDLVFPEEELFIPSKEVIEQLHRARSFSRVNSLVGNEKTLYANLQKQQQPESEFVPVKVESTTAVAQAEIADSSNAITPIVMKSKTMHGGLPMSKTLLFLAGLSVILLGLLAVVLYKKIFKSQDDLSMENAENSDRNTDSDDEEPDYSTYRAKRSERVYV